MARQRTNGLPPGVYQHGVGFRGRYRPDPLSKGSQWSRVFPTPELCLEFLTAAKQRWSAGLPTPRLYGDSVRQTFTFAGYAREVWWPHYLRSEQVPTTQRATKALLEQHVLTAAWAALPLAEISRARLQDWLDVRVDDAVPKHLRGCPNYDFEADLVAVRAATGSGRRVTGDRLRLVRWMIRGVFDLACSDPAVALSVNPAISLTIKRLSPTERFDANRRARDRALTAVVNREHIKPYMLRLPPCDHLPFLLMYACGLRISEAYGVVIGDWDAGSGRLSIVRQHARSVDETGAVVWSTTRLKTRAAERYVYVYPALASAINAYIARHHGPNPDPGARLCVGVKGTSTQYALKEQFRKRLAKAGEYAALTVRTPDGRTLRLTPRPHSLRKAISSELHRCPSIADVAVSAFLGHKLPRHFEGAVVTANYYLSPFDEDLRACAEYIGSILDSIGGPTVIIDRDRYVTVNHAAEILGCTAGNVYHAIQAGSLTGIRDGLLHYERQGRAEVYLERVEVELYRDQRIPPRDDAVPIKDAAKVLGVGLPAARRMMTLPEPELVRWTPPPGVKPPRSIYVMVESVNHVAHLLSRVSAGELLGPSTARLLFPYVVKRDAYKNLPYVTVRGIPHYERETLIRMSDEARPEGHMRLWEAARHHGITNEMFAQIAELSGDQAATWTWVPPEVADAVARTIADERADASTARRAHRATTPLVDAIEQPSRELWMPIVEAASQMSVTAEWVNGHLRDMGAPRQRYDKVVYARRADVNRLVASVIPDGFLTTAQAAERMGRSMSWVSGQCAKGALDARIVSYPGRTRRYLIHESAVRAWQLRNDALLAGQEINVYEAARELQVPVARLCTAIGAGELRCEPPALNTRFARRHSRIRRSDLEAFKIGHMPSTSAMTVREVCEALAASGLAVTEANVHRMIRKGQVPGATRFTATGVTWWLPPTAIAHITTSRADGLLRAGQVLEAAGFEPTARAYRNLKLLTVRGLVPGATVPPAAHQAVYPPEAVDTVRRLLIERGVPVGVAEVAGESLIA